MSRMVLDPEMLTDASTVLFASSENLYTAIRSVGDQSGSLAPGEFTGIAEAAEAAAVWMDRYIAVHRCDIEEFAMFLAVHAETEVAADDFNAAMFEGIAAEILPDDRGDVPAPVRPGPDPAAALPRDGASVAV